MASSVLDLILRAGGGTTLGVGGGGGGGDPGADPPTIPADEIQLNFTLPNSKMVTLTAYQDGVKKGDAYSGDRLAAGSHTINWSAVDEDSNPVTGTVDWKLQTHNIDKIITRLANSSVWAGVGQFQQFQVPVEWRLDGADTTLFASPGYTESSSYLWSAALADLTSWDQVRGTGTAWIPLYTCTDGTYLYLAFQKATSPYVYGIRKYTIADGTWATWSGLSADALSFDSAGGTASANYSGTFLPLGENSSLTADLTYRGRRMSVQTSGNVLAIAMPGVGGGQVWTVHKGTGATIYTPIPSLADVSALSWNSDESKLWVGTLNNTIYPYTKANWLAAGSAITTGDINGVLGFTGAIIDLRCDGAGILAAVFGGDGGDMQIVPIDDAAGTQDGTELGASGGYASTTTIANNRYHFGGDFEPVRDQYPGNIDFYADGSLLIYDCATGRLQKVSDPWGTPSISSIWEAEPAYYMAVDCNDQTKWLGPRLVGFTRTYATDPVAGTVGQGGAIAKDKWYGYALYETHYSVSPTIAFSDSGHLFCIVNAVTNAGSTYHYLTELTSTGNREISSIAHNSYLYNYFHQPTTNDRFKYVFASRTITKEAYTGLDGSNNPTWAAASTHVVLPNEEPLPNPSLTNRSWWVLSDDSVLVIGGATPGTDGVPHLMRIDASGNVLWKHCYETTDDPTCIPFPSDGHGITDSNNPPVNITVDPNETMVCISWSGEGYIGGSSQSNKHIFYSLDGQFIDIVGDDGGQTFGGFVSYSAPLDIGNAAPTELVYGDSKTRLVFNGENHVSGFAEVRLQNESTLAVATLSANVGGSGDFGSIASDSAFPDNMGSVTATESFANLNNFTNDGSFELCDNGVRAKSSVGYGDYTKRLYIATNDADGHIRMDIPSPFNGQGNVSGSDITANWGMFARYNSGTGVLIGAFIQFFFFASHTGLSSENGAFRLYLFSVDADGEYASLGRRDVRWLPSSRDHDYSMDLLWTGADPTKLALIFWDDTAGALVTQMQTEITDAAFQGTGYYGITMTQLCECSRLQMLGTSWTKDKIPFRA